MIDVLQKPNYYMDIMIEMANEDAKYLFYKYGPILFKNYKGIESIKSSNKDVMFLKNAERLNRLIAQEGLTFNEMKKSIIAFEAEMLKTSTDWSMKLKKDARDHIDAIRQFQTDNGILESAMIDYRPIVPYKQFIKKPGATSEWIKPTEGDFDLSKDLFENWYRILNDSEIVEESLSDLIVDNCLETAFNRIVDSENKNPITNLVSKYGSAPYYFAVECIFNPELNTPECIQCMEAIKNITDMEFEDLHTVIEASSVLNESLDTLEMEYLYEKLPVKPVISGALESYLYSKQPESEEFDVEKILSFIYIHTIFRPDEFVNEEFRKSVQIHNYIDIEDPDNPILLAVITDPHNSESRLLSIPVIDLGDNWNTKVITINPQDEIAIYPFYEIAKK